MKLTESQKKAIKAVRGNFLVNSTAGSGKTQVFAMRIANLILKENVEPSNILGLTFTKLAAENMRERLAKFVPKKQVSEVSLHTFHAFARSILLKYFPKEYVGKDIPKDWWKMQVANEICSENDYRNQIGLNLGITGGELLTFISYQKSNMVRKGDEIILDDKMGAFKVIGRSKLQRAFDKYCELSINANVLDFDDMLLELYYKLLLDAEFRQTIANKYEFVMVDEFQDTSKISFEILNLICEDNLFVVGDFRQSIYGFNNAEIENILEFTTVYPDTKLIELKENFRSTKNIIDICNKVIESSPVERYKDFSEALCGKGINGKPVELNAYNNDYLEYESIISKIIELKSENNDLNYSDFAILCRTNAELALVEALLSEHNIPAKLSSSGSFFDKKEIADLLSYCTHTLNRNDDMSIRRIVNVPKRFIGKNGVYVIDEYARSNNLSFEDSVLQIDDAPYKDKFINLIGLFNTLEDHAQEKPDKFLKYLIHTTRYNDYIKDGAKSSIDLDNRLESINTFVSIASKYPTLPSLLANIERIKNNSNKTEDAVNVMTIHASKGLEFPVVFVSGVNQSNFPHNMATSYEEERRLLYVALSRAINELYISFSINVRSKKEPMVNSVFLQDIFGDSVAKLSNNIISGIGKGNIIYSPT